MAGVLNALASYVTKMLADMARDEVAMLTGVSDKIDDLSIKLRDLNNFLAEMRILDALASYVTSILAKMAKEEKPTKTKRPLRLPPLIDRKTDSLIERSGVVGEKIEEDTRALVEVLTREVVGDKSGRLIVVAIVGVGGIRKITLGKKVFNDEAIKGKFTKKIWLSVTQDFTDVELLSTTITAIGADLPRGGGAQAKALLIDALKNAIKDKKFFLVLDDLWDVDAWNKHLMTPFSYRGPGSRVLITTRHDTVARSMKAFHPYHHVDKLAPQDTWSLLKKQVLTSEENEPEVDMLEDIGFQIVAKCDGLPLAIKVKGGLSCKKEKTRRD
ncbi:disease resistance RPP13-like protein 4 [Triticum urartu]|uniref:disease resistance RPP13-like protein 4 n=1 Tax=Triticum urartu TaxID=4572 RepID=UPI002043C1EB|nr:disease resistance RPP13-like protein 4 [Triticum urartu]